MECEHPLDYKTLLKRMLTVRDERVVTCPACGRRVRVEFDEGWGRWLSAPIPALPLIVSMVFFVRAVFTGGRAATLSGLGIVAAGAALSLLCFLACCLVIQRRRLYRILPVSEP